VLGWGCAALLPDELGAVGELDDEVPQAATHSDTVHTKISLCFTVPPSCGLRTACYLGHERDKAMLALSLSNRDLSPLGCLARQLWAVPDASQRLNRCDICPAVYQPGSSQVLDNSMRLLQTRRSGRGQGMPFRACTGERAAVMVSHGLRSSKAAKPETVQTGRGNLLQDTGGHDGNPEPSLTRHPGIARSISCLNLSRGRSAWTIVSRPVP
jgi:hypothetical protein